MKNLLKIFSSKSNFFIQPQLAGDLGRRTFLSEKRKDVDALLSIWGYELSQRQVYLQAFDYFVNHPKDFNGASMTEDLCDIPGLDLDAMLHDYLYVVYKASVSWKYQILSDKLFRSEMRRRGKSSWNRGYRFVMLLLKCPFWIAWCWAVKGRRITAMDKIKMDYIFFTLGLEERVWHKEFRGELTWAAIILAVIIGYIWRVSLLDFIQSLKWLVV
ncbi:hypothetical protein VS868_12065 [Salinimicrobium sp. 3283s]|uniref:hypothetical protein n=1 Tax=Salinimicrobium sp. 3283s TaxID=3114359 RepID=UPI0031EF43F0